MRIEKFIDIIELIKNGYEFQSKLNPHYLVSVGQTIKDFPFGTLQPKFQQVAKISHLKTLILWVYFNLLNCINFFLKKKTKGRSR